MDIDLEKNEIIQLVERKHWFTFAVEMFGLLFALFAPILLLFFLDTPFMKEHIDVNIFKMISFGYLLWVFFIWNAIFLAWTDYYLDVVIITNQRIIDIEQRGIFSREISTLHLSKVQDVTSEVHGILATFLKFGDLHVQTAGQQREFVVRCINNPVKVRQVASTAIENYRNKADIF